MENFDKYRNADVLKIIHSDQPRRIVDTAIFECPAKLAMLDYLGIQGYVISSFGAVWDRHKIFLDKHKKCIKGYLPLVILDRKYPYPWVKLPFNGVDTWFPVNQLLGWTFHPNDNIDFKYFLSSSIYQPLDISTFQWQQSIEEPAYGSKYFDFMEKLYQLA